MVSELEYNFHDAVIVRCEFSQPDRFTLCVELYEIFYPGKQQVIITFFGIFNGETVSQLSQRLNESIDEEDDWIGARINSLKIDEKKSSKENELYFFLDIDWFDPIRIHCQRISSAEIA